MGWDAAAQAPPGVGVPRLRPGIVDRARLTRLLGRGRGAHLTLVTGPAGYGKSVAVETWLAGTGRAAVWISLDGRDNDPARLWSSVATATSEALDGVGNEALATLGSSSVESAIDALARALRRDGRELVVVLDDLHEIDDARCLATLDHGIARLPVNVQLVLVTRTVPALRLARLRAQGQLVEIDAGELTFTAAEARRLMATIDGLAIDDATVRELTARTEGWPAALYLGALHLRASADPKEAVAALGGGQRHIADLLAHEVVAELEPAVARFLIRSSALPRLSGELCDDVLELQGSAAMLRQLERTNLLVTELSDRPGWYRCHALLREHLLSEAQKGEAEELQRRGLAWSLRHGMVEDAAEYAVMCGEFDALGTLVEEHGIRLARTGRAGTLARWTDALPRELLAERPTVLVFALVASFSVGRPTLELQRRVSFAYAAWAAAPDRWSPGDVCLLHVERSLYTIDDAGVSQLLAEEAVRIARTEVEHLLVISLAVLAHAQLLTGDPAATTSAREAIEHPDAADRPYGLLAASAIMALAAARADRPTIAREHADRALRIARDPSLAASASTSWAELADAVTSKVEGRLPHAERAGARAVARAISGGVTEAWMRLELAAIQAHRGRVSAASRSLDRANELLANAVDPGALPAFADAVAAELQGARHRPPAAWEPPSPAETAVLRLLGDHTTREIGDELYLSVNTVKTHIRAIYRKLGVSSRDDAVRRAEALGLLDEATR
jgi:LuxR family maltose regulon positive regulatory protein